MPLLGRKKRERGHTRIFFTTDLHGSDACFKKFVNAADTYDAQVLVVGGDITGKVMVPIVRRGGVWEAEVFGGRRTAQSREELAELEKVLRTNGFYPYRTDPDGVDRLSQDETEVDRVFGRLMRDSISRWMDIADSKLAGSEVRCFVNLGNDDHQELAEIIEASEVVTFPDEKVVEIDDQHTMASLGYSNMTPWKCPRDVTEEELAVKLDDLARRVPNMERCLFNIHVPPYDSNLDLAPELTENLEAVSVGGQPKMVPVGSRAVRAAIEGHQPLAGLHGHVHESRGVAEIGRTLCINPGSEYTEGIVRGVLLNVRDGKLTSHQFVSG